MALIALAASLLTLTACDPSERRDAEKERESRAYQSASADYKAGRIESATKGFADAVREDPANAEARFQLACLLHDSAKDPAGAFCAYREYLMQRPSGDKATLASKRLAMCERELAAALAAKHKLITSSHDAEAATSMRNDLKASKAKIAKLQAELEGAKSQIIDETRVTRIENVATQQFGMVYPSTENVVKLGNAESEVKNLAVAIRSEAYN